MHNLFSQAIVVLLGLFTMLGLPALAEDTSDGASSEASPAGGTAYQEAKSTVEAGNFAAALPMLAQLTKSEPQNADAWNLLGFTYRKLGEYDESGLAYAHALAINPGHLGALEYQGELFLALGQIDRARQNLARLQGLCGTCEEAEDLAKALQSAGA